jgi:hypothetical protein
VVAGQPGRRRHGGGRGDARHRTGKGGFLEDYACQIRGEPTSVIVTVIRNPAGKAQHIVVNHRPRSSVLLFARLMGEKFAGTPLARCFITSEP